MVEQILGPYIIELCLPKWVDDVCTPGQVYAGDDECMRLAISLSHANVKHETGGPFGAAIFNIKTGALLAPGMNLVVPQCCSVAHAEMIAIMLAQQRLRTFDLSQRGRYALFTSTEPCAMCLGAIPWSGLARVVCAATGADAQAIGFDEGDKPNDWTSTLSGRGIEIRTEFLRSQARRVLWQYQENGYIIYNAGL